MSKKAIAHIVVGVVVAFSATSLAEPLSVNILDHDFTFDVPFYEDDVPGGVAGKTSAVYDYRGNQPDVLRLTGLDPMHFLDPNKFPDPIDYADEHPGGEHNVPSYAYSGVAPQVPGPPPGLLGIPPAASPWLYPLFKSNLPPTQFPQQFGAKLELAMFFDANDGPYTNPAGDKFDISLTGDRGRLRITGWIGNQPWPIAPLYPTGAAGGPVDIVLLDIEFSKTTLLARANNDTADLVEGIGRINTLLGHSVADLDPVEYEWLRGDVGVTFFKFMLPDLGGVIYPTANYMPSEDYNLDPVYGRISGEAGVIPEPASLFLLAVGSLAALRRRRKA